MPSRRSSKSKVSGSGVVAVLIILVAVMLYNAWQERNSPTPDDSSSGPSLPQITLVTDTNEQGGAAAPSNPADSTSAAGDAIVVWFSDPLAGKTSGGLENHLIEAIDRAQKSIDIAIYNLSLENIANALITAKGRGVKVRLVMESESIDKKVPQSLADAKIPIVGDQREGLMHNKFAIIDGQEVWMGSMNYTSTSFYKDFNNLVRFRSQRMVANYQSEFDEMFTEKKFGNDKEDNTPYHQVSVNGVPVEIYFSPSDDVSDHVVTELQKAQKSIVILAYSFTSDPFAETIHGRAAAGVQVRGVFDESQNSSNKGGEYQSFKDSGYDVKLDGISGLLHNKVFLIDGKVVITGSYNFSANAEKTNDENLVIIRDAGLASQYMQHFQQVYDSAQ